MDKENQALLLENQICFPLYAVSRFITKLYGPLLQKLNITYPQYLVLLVLWEKELQTVSELTEVLFLESNTLTPLLKRMEEKKLVERKRSAEDERKVMISLTEQGKELKKDAECIPSMIINEFNSEDMSMDEVVAFRSTLSKMLNMFKEKAG